MKNRFSWQVTLLPLFFIVITAAILSIVNIVELQQEKEKQIEQVSVEFIEQQKRMAKDRVMMAVELIRFQSNQTEDLVRKRVKERVDEVIHIANVFYEKYKDTMPRAELEEQLKLLLSNAVFDHPDGYFFSVNMDTEKIIVHKLDKLIGYSMSEHKDKRGTEVLTEQKELLSKSDGAFQTIYFSKPNAPDQEFPKQIYIRYFKPFNWLIGTGEYLDDMEKRLQSHVLKRLKALYTGGNDYLFIKEMHNMVGGDGKPYATLIQSSNPVHTPNQPLYDTDQDSRGRYFRRDILTLLQNHGEGYSSYYHPSPKHGEEVKKTSYFYYDPIWKWTIGSGFYYDVLEEQLGQIEADINARITKDIWLSIAITLGIIVIMSSIFWVISRKISRTINNYATQLEQAQKMESIGNLAGGIAHDFNNLLCPIIGMSQLLMDDLPKHSQKYEYSKEIYNAGTRAGGLVKQILAFSRQTEHEVKRVQIQEVLKEALILLRSSVPSNIEIKQNIQKDCGPVMANVNQLHQIAMNIVTNAFHAVEEKNGIIDVSLEEVEIGFKEVAGSDLQPGKYARMTVSDNGTGIGDNTVNKIFEPYFTTKEQGKGTGLGLAVVYGLVKEYKGDVRVYSEVGKGTTFSIYLPIAEQQGKRSVQTVQPAIATGTEKILLVDDEEPTARSEEAILSRLGYQVVVKTNSLNALEVFKTNPDGYDLVITDMTMPGMTGDLLAREMLAVRPDVPIIICTGFSARINKEKADFIGIKGLLMKPVVRADMAKMVRKVLDEARADSEVEGN